MDDESTAIGYSDVLSNIDSNVSDLLGTVNNLSEVNYTDYLEAINSNLTVIIDYFDSAAASSEVSSTVILDETQFNQLMMLQTSELTVLLFIFAFVIMIFGVSLAHLLTRDWRV